MSGERSRGFHRHLGCPSFRWENPRGGRHDRCNGGLGGITIYLTGASGDQYYYAHLDAWAPGLSVGQSVAVGEMIGTVGNTGNAQYTVPHLHFEFHPGGGSPVNPYPLVAGLCL